MTVTNIIPIIVIDKHGNHLDHINVANNYPEIIEHINTMLGNKDMLLIQSEAPLKSSKHHKADNIHVFSGPVDKIRLFKLKDMDFIEKRIEEMLVHKPETLYVFSPRWILEHLLPHAIEVDVIQINERKKSINLHARGQFTPSSALVPTFSIAENSKLSIDTSFVFTTYVNVGRGSELSNAFGACVNTPISQLIYTRQKHCEILLSKLRSTHLLIQLNTPIPRTFPGRMATIGMEKRATARYLQDHLIGDSKIDHRWRELKELIRDTQLEPIKPVCVCTSSDNPDWISVLRHGAALGEISYIIYDVAKLDKITYFGLLETKFI